MAHALLLLQTGCILGMALVAFSRMVIDGFHSRFYLPLAGLLLTIPVLVMPPLVAAITPDLQSATMAVGLPAIMLIGPLLWLYVSALTSPTKWHWSRQQAHHLIPGMVALLVAAGFQTLPLPVREAMVLRGEAVQDVTALVIGSAAWLLLILWIPLSCYYLVRSATLLLHYQRELKQVFANTEQRQMDWLVLLIALLGLIWVTIILTMIGATLFNYSPLSRNGLTFLALLAVWILVACGLNQQPGFEGHYAGLSSETVEKSDAHTLVESEKPQPEKYSRSALDETRSARIASKINQAMTEQKLYLNSDLTLGDLASAVSTPTNYVSQTLNETLGESFFDYVNNKRVEAAQALLRETDKSILDIAYEVGFNAKSSFYKAFQRNLGMTPGKYREQQRGKSQE